MKNFYCDKTGEKFFVGAFIGKFVEGEMQYFAKGNILVNPANGNPLKKIEGKLLPQAIFTDTKTRYTRNEKYFKERAKKHSQSDEVQHLKKKRDAEEMKVIGANKKK